MRSFTVVCRLELMQHVFGPALNHTPHIQVMDVDVEMVDYIVTLVLGRMEGSNELVKTHNVFA